MQWFREKQCLRKLHRRNREEPGSFELNFNDELNVLSKNSLCHDVSVGKRKREMDAKKEIN